MAERDGLKVTDADDAEPRTADEIRQDIAERREAISATVNRLNDRIQRSFDWREYVVDHPLAAVGVAVGAGLLVSGLFKRQLTPREKIMHALSEGVEDVTGRLREQLDDLPLKKSPAFGKTVKSAVTASITTFATNYLKNQILGGSRRPRHSAREQAAEMAQRHRDLG